MLLRTALAFHAHALDVAGRGTEEIYTLLNKLFPPSHIEITITRKESS